MITPMEQEAPARSAVGRRLGIAALALAIATPVAALVGWVWAGLTPGMAALGVGLMALMVVGTLAAVTIVVSVISLFVSQPNVLARLALLLVGATGVVLALLLFPPSL